MSANSLSAAVSPFGPRPPAARPAKRGRWAGWGFVGPFMVVFAFALVAPIGYAIYLSLFRQQLIGGNSFVGLANYRHALSDPQFWASVRRVRSSSPVQVPVMLVLALLAALALDSARLRWAPLYRLSIFLPYAVPGRRRVADVGLHLRGAVRPRRPASGRCFGGHFPDPLQRSWVLASIGNVVTWEFVGYNMLIFYSALRAVPRELYEAAEIDGAGQFAIIRWIKLPALRIAIVVSLIFSVIGSLQLFNEPDILH